MSAPLTLSETTAAEIDGDAFGVANVWERSYRRADGTAATGLSAELMFADGRVEVVGPGSRVVVGGRPWHVIDVRAGTPGEIVLERAD